MKKLIILVIITALITSTSTGCKQNSNEKTASTGPRILLDGTYTARDNTSDKLWMPEIKLTIAGGKITNVLYDETTAMRKSEDIEYQRNYKAQKNIDLLNVYAVMQNSLIKSQDPNKIDTVAGATKAVQNMKALAAAALKDAKAEGKYKDGDYKAKGDMDEMFWTPSVEITVKDNKIATVKYDEISSKVFKYKSLDKAYIARFKQLKKVDETAAFAALQKSLVDKQDPAKVDTMTGATSSSKNFIEVAAKAIEKATKK